MENRRMALLRIVKASITLFVGAILWRFRIIQVGAFLGASALRPRGRYNTDSPAARCEQWANVEKAAATNSSEANARTLVTYHPEYHQFDPNLAVASLNAASLLGVGWIRSDIRWHEVLPDGERVDKCALVWYRNFLQAVVDRGFKNMVVLSSPPDAVKKQESFKRLDRWRKFLTIVASELGHNCDAYQLMNEPNNPVYRFFDLSDAARSLVLGASVINQVRAAPIAINISVELWGWREYLRKLLELSGRSVQIVGLDHYPGTWTIGAHPGWTEIVDVAKLIASANADSVWFKRRLSILETGFSTNAPLRNEVAQAKFFSQLTSAVQDVKKALPDHRDLLLGIYELVDRDSTALLDPEAHFGLLTTDLRAKQAFEAAKDLISVI
jgi:hypothetical protein